MPSENLPEGRGDIGRREAARGDLIKQRLKEVKVAPINECYLHRNVSEMLGAREAREAAADERDLAMVFTGMRHFRH